MSRVAYCCAAMLVLGGGQGIGHAQTISAFKTGNDLYAQCSTELGSTTGMIEFGACTGYIMGAIDSYSSFRAETKQPACLKPGVTAKQVKDAVVAYLRDHPLERNEPANYLIVKGIMSLYTPCPAGAPTN